MINEEFCLIHFIWTVSICLVELFFMQIFLEKILCLEVYGAVGCGRRVIECVSLCVFVFVSEYCSMYVCVTLYGAQRQQ